MMYRFLLFPGQDSMTWQDEVKFTEMMGEGNAFPDATSANRKVQFFKNFCKISFILYPLSLYPYGCQTQHHVGSDIRQSDIQSFSNVFSSLKSDLVDLLNCLELAQVLGAAILFLGPINSVMVALA